MSKLLVLYVFHEYNHRAKQFLLHSIFYDENVDFIIICNNKSINIDDDVVHYNVSILYRDNIGYDFGGWSDGLLTNDLYKNYTHFIFLNSSVCGPYLPPKYRGKWTEMFLKKITGNVKLVGSTINANLMELSKEDDPKLLWAHVQTYSFSMDIIALQYLIDCGIFSNTKYVESHHHAIYEKEVQMSRVIINNGWNIGSLLPIYQGVDFTFKDKTSSDYDEVFYDDVMYPCYENKLWVKSDLVFIKGNRDNLKPARVKIC